MKPKYNAFAIERRVRRVEVTEETISGVSKSFTKPGEKDEHKPKIDRKTGAVSCTCGDFKHRHADHNPTVWTPAHHCKHLVRLVARAKRRGDLPAPPTIDLEEQALKDAEMLKFLCL